jgi:predicted phage terminase large subunit-like protein
VYKDFPNLCPHIVEYAKSMGYTDQSMIYIEPKASGISIYQMLKLQTGLNYALDKFPGGMTDKVMRVNAQTPRIEAGRVLLLDGAHWVESFIDECAMFPNAAHDECVDILTGAMRKGLKSGIDYTGFR